MKPDNFEEWVNDNIPAIIKCPIVIMLLPIFLVLFVVAALMLPPKLAYKWFGLYRDQFENRGR